jgi:Ras-related protein Rab-1A
MQLIIIGNKCDLKEDREVKTEEIKNKAEELNVEWFEVSAKENINLDEAFDTIIDKVYSKVFKVKKGVSLNNSNSRDEGRSVSKCC